MDIINCVLLLYEFRETSNSSVSRNVKNACKRYAQHSGHPCDDSPRAGADFPVDRFSHFDFEIFQVLLGSECWENRVEAGFESRHSGFHAAYLVSGSGRRIIP